MPQVSATGRSAELAAVPADPRVAGHITQIYIVETEGTFNIVFNFNVARMQTWLSLRVQRAEKMCSLACCVKRILVPASGIGKTGKWTGTACYIRERCKIYILADSNQEKYC